MSRSRAALERQGALYGDELMGEVRSEEARLAREAEAARREEAALMGGFGGSSGLFGIKWLNPRSGGEMLLFLVAVFLLGFVIYKMISDNHGSSSATTTNPFRTTSAPSGPIGGGTVFTSNKPLEKCVSDKCMPVTEYTGTAEEKQCQRMIDMWSCVHSQCPAEYAEEMEWRRASNTESDRRVIQVYTDSWNVTDIQANGAAIDRTRACEIFNGPFYTESTPSTLVP
jgi:hypothetical protein